MTTMLARSLGSDYGFSDGEYHVEAWSPGDGWTRYKIMQVVGNGLHEPFGSTSRSASEMYSALQFAIEVLRRKFP